MTARLINHGFQIDLSHLSYDGVAIFDLDGFGPSQFLDDEVCDFREFEDGSFRLYFGINFKAYQKFVDFIFGSD